MAKYMTEFLILSRLVFVADNLALPMEDRHIVTLAPRIKPMMTRTMAISTNEKPFLDMNLSIWFSEADGRRVLTLLFILVIDEPLLK
jgi:hypothetical protein